MSKGFEMDQRKSAGEWLARTRKQRGIIQQALADAIGIKQPVLSRIENGLNQDITIEQAQAIARTLSVPEDVVLEKFGLMPLAQASGHVVYLTDSIGRQWRVLTEGQVLSKEVADALGALGALERVEAPVE